MKIFDKHADLITGRFPQNWRDPVCVELSNVARYLYSENPKEHWHWSDFPNVAPPWPCAWYEWSTPACVNSEGTVTRSSAPPSRNGVYAISTGSAEDGWLSLLSIWVDCPAERREPVEAGRAVVPISQDGLMDWEKTHMLTPYSVEGLWSLLFPYCLGVSFTHCRNVELTESPVPEAVRKKRQKRGKRSTVFKTLEISPMRAVLHDASSNPKAGLKKRLHICRGHFKDYRNGRGLFGKYRGMFWWEMHVRGDKKAGSVNKDYAVNPSLKT